MSAHNPVVLSTSSVYPEATASGFELAARLGYDGVEVMIGIDPVAGDIDRVEALRDFHEVPVLSIHAPTLLVTQSTWGTDPWHKLHRSGEAAKRLGAKVVVVHPPFRWQRKYGRDFVEGIKRLNKHFAPIKFCVENMYPWRSVVGQFMAYLPYWEPTDLPHDYLTLDLSHASTAHRSSRDYAAVWGKRLQHVHFTDGSGSFKDEHLMPGEGDQEAFELLDDLVADGYQGQIVLEVNSRRAGNRAAREALLGQALIDIRTRLGQDVAEGTRRHTEDALELVLTAAPEDLGPDPRGALGPDWRDG
ncbi:sugar phosphate isomerase/epimerase family protein [Propionibacteriaceae bacterium G1746]|uniref:sugar phosphate isomerase/epimerase family protein n=1 Tax=Aestuariimicrobium sp. G57 TaxID=3418485 RepID=UPI003C1C28A6